MRFASTAARLFQTLRSGLFPSAFSLATLAAGSAYADGFPRPGQITFEEAVTPIAHEMHFFHNWVLLPIIVGITLFVLALLAYVLIRFNEKNNPVAAQTTHNSTLEVAWTVLPVMILVIIAIPSFRLLTHQLVVPPADITVKVTGKQWYWTYDYPKDQGGGFSFDSYLIPESDLKPGDIRQLSVDNEAVVPVGKVVHVLVTGADVIHSFTIPSFGVRIDAVPGRMNETWFKAEREGVYYGQCSKLCGKDHAFMPIAFRVVSPEQYTAWLASAAKKFASNAPHSIQLANTNAPAAELR
ncbi:Cytochrome c oxidase subunit 2 [Methylocella tundrae]|jgi:cytochrome c oxidase subunit 2|uniref:Cytochrome c oxidase subunit 2 n=1 Tax=Methylocella tundrae TaxID=227605 RepID=A0A4V6IMB1_METTU|nr:cytochrome c oxidase subunit II [Methylocella tundrae]WPP05128.1 cytochrome c oxidase subunit II [Methylocella tundrae]VFU07451.1 Cytochrome c oxidase subunit 2 [Methylocella tundrae]VTZ49138.1 Cytochrome c oxidase subunit 2 [Methylocella tundrae]